MIKYLEEPRRYGPLLIFNILKFENQETIKKYFNPNLVYEILSKIYKRRPIVINVSEYIANSNIDIYGIKYVVTGFSSNIYPNIQIINYITYGTDIYNSLSIRSMDTTVSSHLIYREHLGKDNNLHIVMNDFETLGFKKAVKLMSLCETCKFYDDESYYMKCAVHPSKCHETIFECRDYDQSLEIILK